MFFKKSERKAEAQRNLELAERAQQSQAALEKAASSTRDLARDVTTTLQARLDDYISQIDSISRLLTDALLMVDEQGIICSFNPAAEDIFGWKKTDIVDQGLGKLFTFEPVTIVDGKFMDRLCVSVNAEKMTNSNIAYEEFQGITATGQLLYVDVSASKLTRSDRKTYYIILVRDITHRVNTDKFTQQLALRNEELVSAVNASETGLMIIAPNSKYETVFVNKGVELMTGLTRSQLLQTKILDLIMDDGGQFSVRKCLSEEITCNHEVRIVNTNGKQVNADISITPVFKERKLQHWIIVLYDTTELTLAHAELKRSEQHFRAFAETSSEVLIVHAGDKILDWNSRLSAMCGYSDSEITNLNPLDLVHPLERTNSRTIVELNGIAQYETLNITKSGEVLWVAINSQPIEWDGKPARIAVIRDITPFRSVETQLHVMRERYRSVVSNTIDLVCCFDANFNVTFTNQTFREYFMIDLDHGVGFSMLDVIPEEDHLKFIDYMHSITNEVDIRRGVHRVKRGDDLRWQDWIDRGIYSDAGELIEYQSVGRDVTHLISTNK